ncbi:hypothetical protein [Sphingomicrobium astaxanthinifaciens]|uniref:hypothetical protein n=1 Tax=Sphingomicrobium astaxanthinifaciens TaxID=1227949 RepID=UPI002ACD3BDC|nr:hypothetical protein [Sphingomicrobium astaxanthinifaciens]
MNQRVALLALPLAALAGCGQAGPLKPAPGAELPPQPALAQAPPTSDDLLTPPPYARPERVDELVRRSTPRAPDPFDLPPPEGGAAPQPDPATNIDDPSADVSDLPGPDVRQEPGVDLPARDPEEEED